MIEANIADRHVWDSWIADVWDSFEMLASRIVCIP